MTYNFEQIETRSPLTVTERANRLLLLMHQRAKKIGESFCFSTRHLDQEIQSWVETGVFSEMRAWTESIEAYPAISIDGDDIFYLLEFLIESGLIRRKVAANGGNNHGSHAGTENYFEQVITPEGHVRLADMGFRNSGTSQAFVAMWFDPSMDEIYDNAIAPGIREAGYEPIRIDRKDHNNKIDDEIIAEIRRSRFVVADFTHGEQGQRGGVYYEAGFAAGLNIPVIFTCRNDVIDQVHFDTRQYNHITWDEADKLREQLSNRISATIGDGLLKRA